MERTIFASEHQLFRQSFQTFVEREVAPHYERWEREGIVERSLWAKAGAAGFLSLGVPEEDGGSGVDDFRYNAVIVKVRSGWEQLVLAGGVESMSRVPIGSDGGAIMGDPATSLAIGFVPQGIGADLIATLCARHTATTGISVRKSQPF